MTAVTYQRAILKGLQAKPIFQGIGVVKTREERLNDLAREHLRTKGQPVGHKARRKANRAILRLSAKIARKATT